MKVIVRTCAMVCLVLGVTVIIGWFIRSSAIIQINPSFAPMQFNSAICFVLCGLFMFLVSFGEPNWGTVPGVALFIISGLSLLEYLFNFNIGLDQLFMKHTIMVETTHPGRMAPNTAIGFMLCAAAGRFSIGNTWQVRMSGIIGSLIFGLSIVAFVGYTTGLEVAHSWSHDASMAMHTSLGLVAVGIGITFQSLITELKQSDDHRITLNSWITGYAACLALILTMLNLTLPRNYGIEVLFVLLVLLGWFMPYRRAPLILAMVSTLLVFLGLFFVNDYVDIVPLLINSSFAVLAIWIVAGLLNNIKSASLKMQSVNQSLDTEVVRRTAELNARNRDLEQFVYIASHDLQEPLRTITSLTTRLHDKHGDRFEGRARQYMQYIVEASGRMTTLIKDLLEYSKLGKEVRFSRIDCREIISALTIDMSSKLEQVQAELRTGYLPVVRASKTEFRLLFQNLISNSIKFSKKDIPPVIEIRASRKIGEWVFSISDNGIGIPETYKERVFNMFQRLHPQSDYDGTGIGLSHCKKIVELHGGRIWIESEVDHGTSVFFTLPTKLEEVLAENKRREYSKANDSDLRLMPASEKIPTQLASQNLNP